VPSPPLAPSHSPSTGAPPRPERRGACRRGTSGPGFWAGPHRAGPERPGIGLLARARESARAARKRSASDGAVTMWSVVTTLQRSAVSMALDVIDRIIYRLLADDLICERRVVLPVTGYSPDRGLGTMGRPGHIMMAGNSRLSRRRPTIDCAPLSQQDCSGGSAGGRRARAGPACRAK
jgi:hypothetical protein